MASPVACPCGMQDWAGNLYRHKISKNDRNITSQRVNNCYCHGIILRQGHIQEERQIQVAARA